MEEKVMKEGMSEKAISLRPVSSQGLPFHEPQSLLWKIKGHGTIKKSVSNWHNYDNEMSNMITWTLYSVVLSNRSYFLIHVIFLSTL